MDLVPAVLWGKASSLPVAGLEPAAAQKVVFALQQGAQKPEDEAIVHAWLAALQLCQVFHKRLLADLDTVESSLAFWNKRLQSGSHVRFMLLQRGPLAFARHVSRSLHHSYTWLKQVMPVAAEATAAQPSAAAANGTGGTGGGAAAAGGSSGRSSSDNGEGAAAGAAVPGSGPDSTPFRPHTPSRPPVGRTAPQQPGTAAAGTTSPGAAPRDAKDVSHVHTNATNRMQAREGVGHAGWERDYEEKKLSKTKAASQVLPGHGGTSPPTVLIATSDQLLLLSDPPNWGPVDDNFKVVLLEALRNVLAEALAQVSVASRKLWLSHVVASGSGGAAWIARRIVQGSRAPSTAGVPPAPEVATCFNHGLLLQSCAETVQQVMSELEGVLAEMHVQLKELGTEQHTRIALQDAAVARVLTGRTSLSRTQLAPHNSSSLTRQGSNGYPNKQSLGLSTPTQPGLSHRHSSASDGILQEIHPVRVGEVLNVREARPKQLHNNPLASPEPPQLPGKSAPSSPGKALSGIGSFRMLPPPPPPPQDAASLQSTIRRVEAALGVTILPKARAPRASTSCSGAASSSGAIANGTAPLALLSPSVSASVARGAAALWHALEGACEEVGLEGALSRGLPQPDVTGPEARVRGRSLGAADALAAADAAARKAGPLVTIPDWALMPSWVQRNWLGCTVASGALLYGVHWLWKHSAAGGSDDLARWSKAAWEATQASVQVHLVEPLLAVHEELTRTFRDRSSIVSTEEFEADKKSLLRMLADFEHDATRGKHSSSSGGGGGSGSGGAGVPGQYRSAQLSSTATDIAASNSSSNGRAESGGGGGHTSMSVSEQEALLSGMQLVMRSYEREMRDPVRNLFMGHLARAMLIQVQRLKVDTEAAMLEMDQILKANELSIALVAAIPALLVTVGAVTTVGRWFLPRAPDLQRAAVPCRMAVAALQRTLQRLSDQETASHTSSHPYHHTHDIIQTTTISPTRQAGSEWSGQADVWSGVHMGSWLEAEGMCVYRMHKVYQEAVQLFRLHDRTSRYSEWPSLSADLSELATTQGAAARMRVLDRMMRTYKVFHT